MFGVEAAENELRVDSERVAWLRRRVRRWYSENGRAFPWRETGDPFHILIAEVLLQRTRADLVPAVYEQFISRFPNPEALSEAPSVDVVTMLRPLGLAHRSARLPSLGRALVEDFDARVPQNEAALRSLPGVGRYVANAVLLLAFDEPRPLVDPNVIRLLERVVGVSSTRSRPREDHGLWRLVERIVPRRSPRAVALGLIDLGALVCLPRRPRCAGCPLRTRCTAFQSGRFSPLEET